MAGVLLMAGCASALAYVPERLLAVRRLCRHGLRLGRDLGHRHHADHRPLVRRKRGLALNLALTGASAAGFVVVPALVSAIERFGLGPGVMLDLGHAWRWRCWC